MATRRQRREAERRFQVSIPDSSLFTWESQVCQYPVKGEPGISYMEGPVPGGIVDCLLFRGQDGRVIGILNHFNFYSKWEKPGNVNIWIHPDFQGGGIGTALWQEAVKRWNVRLEGQRFTEAGARMAEALWRKGYR